MTLADPRPVAKSLRHRTMAAAAAEELRTRILDGRLPAGEPLRQEALAQALGVSRIPLREALLQLEAEGLIRIEPHKGAVVLDLSAAEITEVFELRRLLEPRLLAASIPRLDATDFAALAAILDEYDAEIRAHNVGRWGEINSALHLTLYGKADRPRTLAIVAPLLKVSDRYSRIHLTQTDDLARAEAEHVELVRLARLRAVEPAARLLAAHLDHTARRLLGLVERREREMAQPSPAKR